MQERILDFSYYLYDILELLKQKKISFKFPKDIYNSKITKYTIISNKKFEYYFPNLDKTQPIRVLEICQCFETVNLLVIKSLSQKHIRMIQSKVVLRRSDGIR